MEIDIQDVSVLKAVCFGRVSSLLLFDFRRLSVSLFNAASLETFLCLVILRYRSRLIVFLQIKMSCLPMFGEISS